MSSRPCKAKARREGTAWSLKTRARWGRDATTRHRAALMSCSTPDSDKRSDPQYCCWWCWWCLWWWWMSLLEEDGALLEASAVCWRRPDSEEVPEDDDNDNDDNVDDEYDEGAGDMRGIKAHIPSTTIASRNDELCKKKHTSPEKQARAAASSSLFSSSSSFSCSTLCGCGCCSCC